MCECGMEVKAGDISCPRCGSLAEGYYGHDPSCDCAVCDDIAFSRSLRGTPYTEPAAIELLRQKKEKFESALKKIARGTLEPGHVYEQAVMMQDIAIKVLQEEHGCTVMGAKVCFACGECDPLVSADLSRNCGGSI